MKYSFIDFAVQLQTWLKDGFKVNIGQIQLRTQDVIINQGFINLGGRDSIDNRDTIQSFGEGIFVIHPHDEFGTPSAFTISMTHYPRHTTNVSQYIRDTDDMSKYFGISIRDEALMRTINVIKALRALSSEIYNQPW